MSHEYTPKPPHNHRHITYTHCQVTTCPMHNNGLPIVDESLKSFYFIKSHVLHLHNDIFLCLLAQTLDTIQWTLCCHACTYISNNHVDLTSHCTNCILHINLIVNEEEPDYSSSPMWKLTFHICHISCQHELNLMIQNATNQDTHQTEIINTITE